MSSITCSSRQCCASSLLCCFHTKYLYLGMAWGIAFESCMQAAYFAYCCHDSLWQLAHQAMPHSHFVNTEFCSCRITSVSLAQLQHWQLDTKTSTNDFHVSAGKSAKAGVEVPEVGSRSRLTKEWTRVKCLNHGQHCSTGHDTADHVRSWSLDDSSVQSDPIMSACTLLHCAETLYASRMLANSLNTVRMQSACQNMQSTSTRMKL